MATVKIKWILTSFVVAALMLSSYPALAEVATPTAPVHINVYIKGKDFAEKYGDNAFNVSGNWTVTAYNDTGAYYVLDNKGGVGNNIHFLINKATTDKSAKWVIHAKISARCPTAGVNCNVYSGSFTLTDSDVGTVNSNKTISVTHSGTRPDPAAAANPVAEIIPKNPDGSNATTPAEIAAAEAAAAAADNSATNDAAPAGENTTAENGLFEITSSGVTIIDGAKITDLGIAATKCPTNADGSKSTTYTAGILKGVPCNETISTLEEALILVKNVVMVLLLPLVGTLFLIMMIIGGILYISSRGNEQQAERAKKTLTAAIVGLIIVILSYTIITVFANAIGGDVSGSTPTTTPATTTAPATTPTPATTPATSNPAGTGGAFSSGGGAGGGGTGGGAD